MNNHWARHFQNYDRFMNNFSQYQETIKFHVLKHKYSKNILDDGCGTGNLTLALLKNGKKVYAIDYEPAAIKIVRDKCIDYKKNLKLKTMNGQFLNYPDKTFDGVSSMFVIPFVEDNLKYVSEIFRVLKSDGIAVISAWIPREDRHIKIVKSMEEEFKFKKVLPKYQKEWEEFLETSKTNTKTVNSSYNTLNLKPTLEKVGFINIKLNKKTPYGEYAHFFTCQKPN